MLSGLFALALLATAGYGVNKSMNSDANLSDLALANVEALANGEIKSGDSCYSNGVYDANKPKVVKCGSPCRYEPTALPFFPSTSYCL